MQTAFFLRCGQILYLSAAIRNRKAYRSGRFLNLMQYAREYTPTHIRVRELWYSHTSSATGYAAP